MDIGRAIRDIRKQRGVSQVQLSGLTGLSQAAISQIEKGRRPNEQTLAKIGWVMKVPVPVIYMLAMDKGDFPKEQHALYDMLEPVLRSMLMRFVG